MVEQKLAVQATVRLRNAAMLAARKHHGFSQVRLAKAVGTSIEGIRRLESFNYSNPRDAAYVEEIAQVLGLQCFEIMPDDLRGQHIQSNFIATREVEASKLLDLQGRCEQRLLVEGPEEAFDVKERSAAVKKALSHLSFREREIIKARYGIDQPACTRREVGKRFNVTRTRVTQLEEKAIAKMQHSVAGRHLDPWRPEAREVHAEVVE